MFKPIVLAFALSVLVLADAGPVKAPIKPPLVSTLPPITLPVSTPVPIPGNGGLPDLDPDNQKALETIKALFEGKFKPDQTQSFMAVLEAVMKLMQMPNGQDNDFGNIFTMLMALTKGQDKPGN